MLVGVSGGGGRLREEFWGSRGDCIWMDGKEGGLEGRKRRYYN